MNMEILLAVVANYIDNIVILMENKLEQLALQDHIATINVNLAVMSLQNSQNIVPAFGASTAIFFVTNNATRLSQGIHKLFTRTRQISFKLFVIWTGSQNDFNLLSPQLAPYFTLDSEVFWICENSLQLWETYSIKGEPVVLQTPFNLDDTNLGTKLTASKYKTARRRNFRHISIVATAPDDPGYYEEVKLAQDLNGAKFLQDGIVVDVYRIFRDYLNFSEGLIEGAYMLEQAPPTDRMQVHLQNGKADLCIALNTVEEEKNELVRFLHPLAATWLDIRFVEPPSMWTFLTRPFQLTLWHTMAAYAILLSLIISFAQWSININPESYLTFSHYFNNIFHVIGTLCIQDWYKCPNHSTLRIIMLVGTSVGLVLNSAYSGILTAQLAIKKLSTMTIEKLLDREAQVISLEDDVSFPIDLGQFPQWQDVQVYTVFENEPQALKSVIEGKEAWIMFPEYYHSVTEMANYSDHEACDLTSAVRASTRPTLTAMAVNKTSEFKQVFDYLTLKLLEQGLIRRLLKKYKSRRILKCVHDQRNLGSPTLLDLALAFVILCTGIIASALALSTEVVVGYICAAIF